MKLAIISQVAITYNGQVYQTQDLFGKYVEAFSPYFEEIIIVAPLLSESSRALSYQFKSQNISCFPLSGYQGDSNLKKITKYINYVKALFKSVRQWDIVYAFIPGYLGLIGFWLAKFRSKLTLIYVAGDWQAVSTFKIPRIPKFLIPIYTYLNGVVAQLAISCASLVLVHGKELFNKYKDKAKRISMSPPRITLSKEDLYFRDDTCISDKIQLLYVGRLSPEKGLPFLIDAVAILKSEEYNVFLNIVGSGEMQSELETKVEKVRISNCVKFWGYVPNGPMLFDIYKASDIFVIPSLSEGLPRVLYEAMANSVPIIATNVGGIPHLIKDEYNGLIISPASAQAIVSSIKRIIEYSSMRQQLIKNGQKISITIVKENAADHVVRLLKTHFADFLLPNSGNSK